jgi:hypothetical protein|tara:strand:+ start:1731 stop:2006 length:276 start_codon:yes stop_codon:yes gene_type:complete
MSPRVTAKSARLFRAEHAQWRADREAKGWAVYNIGDRVKVIDQEIYGEIVRWDGGRAVIADDDSETWIDDPELDDGTLCFSLWDLAHLSNN